MGASSGSRALVFVLAAVGLTAGGFFFGRKLSQKEPASVSASPRPPAESAGADEGSVAGAPTQALEPAITNDASETSVPGMATAAGRPAGRRSAPAVRSGDPRAGSAPAAPGPPLAPRELGSGPIRALPEVPAGPGFAAGLTRIGSTHSSSASLKGFDPAAVALKRAPRSEGSIEFEVAPSQLTPGQPYAVKVYLRNQGEKPIQIKKLTISSELNGHNSRGALSPRSKQVEPSLVGLLTELAGVWKEGVTSWSLEVEVLTSGGDTYSNRVAWK